MKLNNKGFAISTIMYMILIMAIILISLTFVLLNNRRFILDSAKEEAKRNIYAKCKLLSGNISTVGSEIACGTEYFYIVEATSSTVTALSKYNITLSTTSPKQDPTDTEYPPNNAVLFSKSNYWIKFYDPVDVSYEYIDEFKEYGQGGSKYGQCPYVYDSRSNLYPYVEAYRDVLAGMGVNIIDAKLLSYEQAIALGCSKSSWNCTSAPSWVYSVSYWLGTDGCSGGGVWNVTSEGAFDYGGPYGYGDSRGIRPLITIDKNEINFN